MTGFFIYRSECPRSGFLFFNLLIDLGFVAHHYLDHLVVLDMVFDHL